MSISPSLFLTRMENRWSGFGNVVSAPLQTSWNQLCTALNDKLRASEDPFEEEVWKVLCPPTGSGKTQGLIVYASILNNNASLNAHPGMIIVTRRIEDADNIARQINELSREYTGNPNQPEMAISYHSDKKGKVKMSVLAEFPVLIITHKAYSMALDVLNRNAAIEDTWEYFYYFKTDRRKLVVIDEAIDLVEYSEINIQDLSNVLHFSESIKTEYAVEWKTLSRLKELLVQISDGTVHQHKEMILKDRPTAEWFFRTEDTANVLALNGITLSSLNCLDLTAFKKALRSIKMDRVLQKNDPSENNRLINKCHETVSAIDALFKTFIYYSRNQSKSTFNAARFIVPPEARGGVILDATAKCNVVYDLFKGASVIQPPTGTRNYRNVSLHASYGHKVGRSDMGDTSNALQISQDLVAHLEERFSKDKIKRKVLVVTHKSVEPLLLQCLPNNFKMSVAHWGAVDGSNEWNDYDTVVIFGLPYKPKRWSASVFMGYQGIQSTSWLRDSKLRQFKNHVDIRKAIDNGQMTTDIIQAVNRIHCRGVIDVDGNCPVTDIFMLLPTVKEAESLLEGVSSEMPGISIKEWDYSHQKQGKRGRKPTGRGNWDESVVSYLKTLKSGDKVSASIIKCKLFIKDDAWKDLITRIKTVGTFIRAELLQIDVIYQMEKQRAAFLKV